MHPYVNIRRRLLQILDSLPPSSLNLSGELFYCFFTAHLFFLPLINKNAETVNILGPYDGYPRSGGLFEEIRRRL